MNNKEKNIIIPPDIGNIAIIIVTYNPTSNLYDLLSSLPANIQVIIVDNNSQGQSLSIINTVSDSKNVEIIKNSKNLGIATALNQGVTLAKNKNFSWVIFFDQDSLPSDNIIRLLFDTYENYLHKNKLALVGVNYDTNGSKYVKNKIKKGIRFFEMDTIITSGSMLSISVFDKIGPFRDDFFIDCVDLEYCLRIKNNDYKTVLCSDVGMIHKIGLLKTLNIFGLNFNSTNHNAIRRYYMARNNIIISKMYFFNFPLWTLKKNYFYLISFLQILIVDDNKTEKIRNSIKGIINGIKN